jgi:hypothetical protein
MIGLFYANFTRAVEVTSTVKLQRREKTPLELLLFFLSFSLHFVQPICCQTSTFDLAPGELE